MDTQQKLELLADASRYDLSCACGTKDGSDHRRRGAHGMWLYPVSLPRGGTSIMLKTLMSNACANDCRYCPFRCGQDIPRCTLSPEEVAAAHLDAVRRYGVFGLFLSSGVMGDADFTMDRMIAAASLLRQKHQYRGYIHLKIIPGASDEAIAQAVGLASAVSLNVEAPKASYFRTLSQKKDFDRDIVRPIKLISRLTAPGTRYARVKQTTQFVVGAAQEKDADILQATYGLYRRLGLDRVYFSAYQKGLGDASLPGESSTAEPADLLTREHRLYQAEFLLRLYKWDVSDIVLESDGNLSLTADPKQRWAQSHPEFFPVRLRSAEREALLRVPGLGPVTADRILNARKQGGLRRLEEAGLRGVRLEKAAAYVVAE
ncbi:MAG: radical SAM protein [Elusimicrobiota bacterium]|jgi:predicted DNA-binding helix-hairpin-helix protein